MAAPKTTDISTFDDKGWKRDAMVGSPESIPTQLVAKIAGPVTVDVGELAVKVGRLPMPGSPDKVSAQGDVSVTIDGKAIPNIQRIVIIGDAKTGWSAEVTLYPLITRE